MKIAIKDLINRLEDESREGTTHIELTGTILADNRYNTIIASTEKQI